MTLAFALAALITTQAPSEPTVLSRLVVGLDAVGAISLTQARTQGGLGGGVRVGWALSPAWFLEARAAWLVGLGSHSLLHLGGGWQREGTWRPALRADLALGLGGALDFNVGAKGPSRAPTLGLVVGAAPLRWQVGRAFVSALEVEGGVSTELLSVGPRVVLTVLSLSAPLE